MSTGTGIEWATHTFNPWWGCTKVHAGCTFCYAEAFDRRVGGAHWANNPRRMVLGEWGKPAKWNKAAPATGLMDRVFCASMCDLFEDYDGPVVDQQGNPVVSTGLGGHYWTIPALRMRVFSLIKDTPNLYWLLLTKRPENITRMVPQDWLVEWPRNVMTGTSPCNQETADASIPDLLSVPGAHFLSCEPLLGGVNLEPYVTGPVPVGVNILARHYRTADGKFDPEGRGKPYTRAVIDPLPIQWVIVGCESNGSRTRRMPDGTEAGYWDAAANIVGQCQAAGIAVFHKQAPCGGLVSHEMDEWPEPMRVREFPREARL